MRVGKFKTRREAETVAAKLQKEEQFKPWITRLPRHAPSPLAPRSGVLLALSFPQFGHPAFGWIALTPLLVALDAARTLAAHGVPARA